MLNIQEKHEFCKIPSILLLVCTKILTVFIFTTLSKVKKSKRLYQLQNRVNIFKKNALTKGTFIVKKQL